MWNENVKIVTCKNVAFRKFLYFTCFSYSKNSVASQLGISLPVSSTWMTLGRSSDDPWKTLGLPADDPWTILERPLDDTQMILG